MLDAKPVCCLWSLPVRDIGGITGYMHFHLVAGTEPLLIGDDVLKCSMTDNMSDRLHLFQPDGTRLTYHTYCSQGGNRRRLSVVPPPQDFELELSSDMRSYMSSHISYLNKHGPMKFAQRLHNYSHATSDDMKRICKMANILDRRLQKCIDNVYSACHVCCRTGRPKTSRKVSLSHIASTFNQSVQVDFFFPTIRGIRRTLLHMRDRGTGYSEIEALPSRDLDDAAVSLDRTWLSRHGAPGTISGDQEFNKGAFKRLLKAHDILFEARPARRHNKVGSVERNNAVLRVILDRIAQDCDELTVSSVIARASFLSNLFSGSKLASSFEQARGYTPGICGLRGALVSPELIRAHEERVAQRALHRLLSSKSPKVLSPHILPKGTKIYALLQKGDWEPLTVFEAQPHIVLARRNDRGPNIAVAYEDVRIAPSQDINKSLVHIDVTNTDRSEDEGGEMDSVASFDKSNAMSADHPTPVQKNIPSMLTHRRSIGDASRDVGQYIATTPPRPGTLLETNEQQVLEKIKSVIGNAQVTVSKLSFAPEWAVQNAFNAELENWKGVYSEMPESEVALNANVIRSHTVYKIKSDEHAKLKLKARIVAHGNEDKDRDAVRKDSAAAQFVIIRLLLSTAALRGFQLGKIDVKKAYLQSGPIKREIYVRPPREWNSASDAYPKRGILWKLLKLPYGIVEAGRQWQLVAESWLLEQMMFERVPGLSQIFTKRDKNGHITVMLTKVIDDFLVAGSVSDISSFVQSAKQQFEIGCVVIDDNIKYNGTEIEQASTGSIKLSMHEYCGRITPIPLTPSRRKNRNSPATPEEHTQYLRLAGLLNFLGKGALPCASFVTSHMLQKSGRLNVAAIVEANSMQKEISKLSPVISFVAPASNDKVHPFLCSFSDASFNISSKQSYGQTGIFCGLAIPQRNSVLLHPIEWSSSKQHRVTYSSFGAEIIACAAADDRAYYLRQGVRALLDDSSIKSHINIDSRGLFDTLTTLHDGRDYRLRQTVQRIRDSFDGNDIDVLRWIRGSDNVADALTKRNIVLYRLLNDICVDGTLHIALDQGYELDSHEWK